MELLRQVTRLVKGLYPALFTALQQHFFGESLLNCKQALNEEKGSFTANSRTFLLNKARFSPGLWYRQTLENDA